MLDLQPRLGYVSSPYTTRKQHLYISKITVKIRYGSLNTIATTAPLLLDEDFEYSSRYQIGSRSYRRPSIAVFGEQYRIHITPTDTKSVHHQENDKQQFASLSLTEERC
jgi:hypothetical protein